MVIKNGLYERSQLSVEGKQCLDVIPVGHCLDDTLFRVLCLVIFFFALYGRSAGLLYNAHMPRVDDALQFLIEYLRAPRTPREGQAYGYDVYMTNVCRAYAQTVENMPIHEPLVIERRVPELTPVFYEAAWELCRRGILRPGVRRHGEQATDDGSAGNGYSLTSRGREWLADAEHAVFIPTEPARVAELLGRYRDQFGEGFFQRAQEAVKSHSATAYLACCVMCGAAAESILLSLAVEKAGDENQVLTTYRTASGRRRITQQILHGVSPQISASFIELTALLNYWRDDASHGTASEISEFEAYEALARLLRFAHFATDHRAELVA